MVIGATQSPSAEDNMYQEGKRAVEWQSIYGCCVETLLIVTDYTSHFAINWQKVRDISLTSGLYILSIHLTADAMPWKLLPWSQVV